MALQCTSFDPGFLKHLLELFNLIAGTMLNRSSGSLQRCCLQALQQICNSSRVITIHDDFVT